jgi:histidyl-tRNA synthetase
MQKSIQSVRGMRDLLPAETPRWRLIEDETRALLAAFGYDELRLPLLEFTALFSRGVGESTDIVEKEMYSLTDRDGDSLTLRPEGTASCVRLGLQHGLLFNQQQRLWYAGPMFRYERPQKGRYRQFDQIGVEAFGAADPALDAELIQFGDELFRRLGVRDQVSLELNTLGTAESRAAHRDALVAYLTPLRERLDSDSQRRLERNPLRILDSKDPDTQALLQDAPKLQDFLDDASRAHFDQLRALLDQLGISYRLNTHLVRGLDYYTHSVFEWVTTELGAQGTVCAGGRYDGLVEQLGGKPTPAAGFAIGVDRLVLLHEAVHGNWPGAALDIYAVVAEPAQAGAALAFCQQLRVALPGLRLRLDTAGGKLKNQFKRADASGARWALVLGAEEVAAGKATVKWLREQQPQAMLGLDELRQLLTTATPPA